MQKHRGKNGNDGNDHQQLFTNAATLLFHLDNGRHFANMSHNRYTTSSGSDLYLSLQNQTKHSPGAGVGEVACLFTQRPAGKSVDL